VPALTFGPTPTYRSAYRHPLSGFGARIDEVYTDAYRCESFLLFKELGNISYRMTNDFFSAKMGVSRQRKYILQVIRRNTEVFGFGFAACAFLRKIIAVMTT
jgi:hypothetical protein